MEMPRVTSGSWGATLREKTVEVHVVGVCACVCVCVCVCVCRGRDGREEHLAERDLAFDTEWLKK